MNFYIVAIFFIVLMTAFEGCHEREPSPTTGDDAGIFVGQGVPTPP